MSGTHTAIKRAFEARRANQEQLKALYDSAEGREFSADEAQKEEAILSELRNLSEREIELVELAEKEARAAEYFTNSAAAAAGGRAEPEQRHLAEVFRDIAEGRTNGSTRIELRDDVALVAGTATDGAEVVQTDLSRDLVGFLQENIGVMRAGARVINTSSGNPITVPTVTSYSTPALVAEAGTIGRSAPQFSTIQLDAYKYSVLIQASRELLQDSAFNVVPFLVEQATEELAREMGSDFVVGTGSSQPQGVSLATANTDTFAGTAAITTDELVDIYHGIVSPYRTNATWIMKDSTVNYIRKLKDGENQYLWQPGLAAGIPDMLFGRPVVTDDSMPALATGNKTVIFGDLRRAYSIRMVGGLDVARSDEFAFDVDLASWRFVARADGALVDEKAVIVASQA